jgi:hypothetical protein
MQISAGLSLEHEIGSRHHGPRGIVRHLIEELLDIYSAEDVEPAWPSDSCRCGVGQSREEGAAAGVMDQ